MSRKLISVHFPKAAGTSLASAYAAALGADRVLRDYGEDPVDPCALINLHPFRYEETKPTSLGLFTAVHGHFHIRRYDRISDAVRVVVLREPVDNLISIYYFWDALRRGRQYSGHSLYKYFCESQLGLIDLATIPALRKLMSGVYFRDVDMGCFDVIGNFQYLDGYLRRVSDLIGLELGFLPKLNVAPPSDERTAVSEDPRTLARLRDLLADDLRFYERYCVR